MTNKPEVVLKFDNTSEHLPCAICGEEFRCDYGYAPFLEGTWRPVCHQCAEKWLPRCAAACGAANNIYEQWVEAEVRRRHLEAREHNIVEALSANPDGSI